MNTLDQTIHEDHVLCLTGTAASAWAPASCAVATTRADENPRRARYACGCTPDAGWCSCPGFALNELAPGSSFDLTISDVSGTPPG